MPQMVMKRNYVLRTTLGHTIAFKKGEEVSVPKVAVQKALEIGAEFVTAGDSTVSLPEEEPLKVVSPQGDARETAIFNAFHQLIAQNDSEDFTSGGKPKFKAVSAVAGFKVDAKEVGEQWDKYHEMLAALKG
jgi:hypothetical protein